MNFLSIGNGNYISSSRITVILSAEAHSEPLLSDHISKEDFSIKQPCRASTSIPAGIRRIISAAKEVNLLIDATCGKKTKTVFILDSGHVVLSSKCTEGFESLISEINI